MKNLIQSLILSAILLAPSIITAQAPAIQWQKTIGGDEDDFLTRIIQTTDGGYIITGYSYSVISGDKKKDVFEEVDCWLVKLDATGDSIEWQQVYEAEGAIDIQQTSDGGYILGLSSFTYGYPGLYDYYLIKTDATGEIQWQDTLGGTEYEDITAIIETPDKGYLIGGNSQSDSSGNKTVHSRGGYDMWLVKIDSLHQIQWQKAYGGDGDDFLSSMYKTPDGGYVLGSQSNSGISGDKTEASDYYYDYWVLKIDNAGNILRQNTIKAGYADYLREAIPTPDGGYFVAGYSYSDSSDDKTEHIIPNSLGNPYREIDYWVLEIDSLMEIKWQRVFGGGDEDQLEAVCTANDNGYLLAGWSRSPIEASKTIDNHDETFDVWLVRIDSLGNILWQKVIGTYDDELIYSINPTKDSGFVMGIWSAGGISFEKTEESRGNRDYWVVKLEPENLSAITNLEVFAANSSSQNLEIYPNPVIDKFSIKYNLEIGSPVTIQLFDVNGRLIESFINNEYRSEGDQCENFSILKNKSGLYFIKLNTNQGTMYKKLAMIPN